MRAILSAVQIFENAILLFRVVLTLLDERLVFGVDGASERWS